MKAAVRIGSEAEVGPEADVDAAHTSHGSVSTTSLRQTVVKGGVYLALREGVGVFAGLVGAILLTRIIGPHDFGLYVALIMIFTYMQNLSTLGVDAFLIRSEKELGRRQLDEAFTLLAVLSIAVTVAGELLMPFIARFTHLHELGVSGRLAILALPIVVVGQVPLAKLERDLQYRTVALIEGTAQVLLYVVALPLALLGWGANAAIIGWLSQQLFIVIAMFIVCRYRPALRLTREQAGAMAGYGASFSASIWIWQLRNLVNPLIVARYAGPSAVGMIGLAIRLVENLAFVKTATWRLSIAALARVQAHKEKLVSAIEEGMSLQLLALGPLLVGFACFGRQLLPMTFGADWLPALAVFPYIAVSYLANAAFNVHSSALYVVKRNWLVTRFHIAHIALFGVAAAVLVPHAGARGYGYAELIALPSYLLIHHGVASTLGSPRYRVPLLWLCGMGTAVFVTELGWWTLGVLIAVAAWPGTWREVARYLEMLKRRKPWAVPS